MKHFVTILFILALKTSISQTYVPFISTADSSDQWYSWSVCGVDGGGSCLEYYRTRYSLDGDTIINGITYTRLSAFQEHAFEPGFFSPSPCPPSSSVSTFFAGGIRESNKQVFFYDEINSSERMIYDFNVGAGDTIPDPSPSPYGFGPYHIIDSVDSVLLGGVYRKRFCLPYANQQPVYIIEGMGSSFGLLQNIGDDPLSCSFGFSCYGEYGTALFPYYFPESCADNLGMESQVMTFELFPNPTKDFLSIRSNSGGELEVEVINAFGQIVKTTRLWDAWNQVDVSDLIKGIYFVKVSVDGKVGVQKLVVE